MAEDLLLFRLNPLGGNLYRMEFGIGFIPKKVSGIQKLAQHVAKMVLMTPGTDSVRPSIGGGILKLLRVPSDPDEALSIQTDLQVAISEIENQILDSQEGFALPSDERLENLEVAEVTLDEEAVEWRLVLTLRSEAGESLNIDVSDILVKGNG